MTIQEAITRKALEREVVSKELILNYLASKKVPVDYDSFINNRLFKRPSWSRYYWWFYDNTGVKDEKIEITTGRRVLGIGGERQSTGIFDINGILLFDLDIVYHKQTNLFYVVKKEEKNIYLCREGKQYSHNGHLIRNYCNFILKDLVVSQDLKFVSSSNDETKFYERYVLKYDNEQTIY